MRVESDLARSDETKRALRPGPAGRAASGATSRPEATQGWTIYEPGFMAIGLLLVGVGIFLGWWGIETDVSNIPYRTSQGVEFGPVYAGEWQYTILPGAVRNEVISMPWWEFVAAHPEFAGYATIGFVLSFLYFGALGLTGYALFRRWARGPRHNGWPTVAQAIAFAAVAAAIVIATLTLPGVADVSSFFGSFERTQWGPRFGWLLALAAPVFLGASTLYGWRTDRNLRGLCWKCYRPPNTDPCEHCGSAQ